ncbi:hypothetical protein BJV82DRAFT_612264 [Fennellomyces sp. T-0311]|nr:hypothetical protein BJV82DRAFT_612264 [Fennellomyces sp. T-0311]
MIGGKVQKNYNIPFTSVHRGMNENLFWLYSIFPNRWHSISFDLGVTRSSHRNRQLELSTPVDRMTSERPRYIDACKKHR